MRDGRGSFFTRLGPKIEGSKRSGDIPMVRSLISPGEKLLGEGLFGQSQPLTRSRDRLSDPGGAATGGKPRETVVTQGNT